MEVYKPWDFCKERNCYGIGKYPDKEKRKKHYCKGCGAYSMHQYLKRHGQILEEGSDLTFQLAEAQADNVNLLQAFREIHRHIHPHNGPFYSEYIDNIIDGIRDNPHPGAPLLAELERYKRALSLACKELPAIPDEIGRLEDIFLYQARAGDTTK